MPNILGKLIVIDGTDGSGKATQTKLLADRLKLAGFNVETADFPQYGKKSAGLVEEYLNGKYGTAEEVGPYLASTFYAVDRYDASFTIKKWLSEGKIVISNRYVTANMGHQGGKIKDANARKEYFNWLYRLEYEMFSIPKPDLNIILHVPAAAAQKLVDNKGARAYVNGGKRDMHEADLSHLQNAEQVYLELASAFPDFTLIECVRDNELMSPEKINDLIWDEILKLLKVEDVIERQENKPPSASMENFYENLIKERENENNIFTSPNFLSTYNNKKIYASEKNPSRDLPLLRGGENRNKLAVELISPFAKLPTRAHQTDAGLDLYALENYSLTPGEKIIIRTGVRIAIPDGCAGFIWDKSGLARDGLHVTGGVIDSGYRGEILINMVNLGLDIINISRGQKVAQIIIQKIELPEIKESIITDETERGENGFGSTGKF